MEIKYEIPDDKVRSFTGSAKRRLQEQAQKYTLEIISEAEKVEELIRENGASTEITDNIIFQAVRRNKTERKKSIKTILKDKPSEISMFIGSEGGFSSEEVNLVTENGGRKATLGKRILRAETAPLVALTLIMYETENME